MSMNPPSLDDPMQNQLRVYDDETMRSITRHAEDRGYLKAQAEYGQQIADLRAQVEKAERELAEAKAQARTPEWQARGRWTGNGASVWLLLTDGSVIGPHYAYGDKAPEHVEAFMEIPRPKDVLRSPSPSPGHQHD